MANTMTVGDLITKLQAIGADDLPIKIASYEGDHGMAVYTARKHVITDEEDTVTDAYVVLNG